MTRLAAPSSRLRLSSSASPARRLATCSILMVAASAGALIVGSAAGAVLQLAVFDLEEQQLLTEAGAWGYVAAFCLVSLMVLPAVVGIALGVRARHLGERRLGTTGILLNALTVAYLVLTGVGALLLG
jgi:hypothetical protein